LQTWISLNADLIGPPRKEFQFIYLFAFTLA